MVSGFLTAFVTIFFAEMGDKSQLLALAFATKYPLRKVLFGLFLGILCNHALAVMVGTFISHSIQNLSIVRIVAAFAFILFGLWSFKTKEEEAEATIGDRKVSPVLAITIAFFAGELGDKTQLSTLAMAATTDFPLVLLAATVSAMMVVGMIGIFVGATMGRKIPEKLTKFVSGLIFIAFGIMMLIGTVDKHYLTVENILPFALAILVPMVYFFIQGYKMRGKKQLL